MFSLSLSLLLIYHSKVINLLYQCVPQIVFIIHSLCLRFPFLPIYYLFIFLYTYRITLFVKMNVFFISLWKNSCRSLNLINLSYFLSLILIFFSSSILYGSYIHFFISQYYSNTFIFFFYFLSFRRYPLIPKRHFEEYTLVSIYEFVYQ